MELMGNQKVKSTHLKRMACLYIRQSTIKQVMENTESTKRQYALRQRAVALGWPIERVIVIDSDLGMSGASSDRAGFQKLVAEVGMGRVGIVLGLEVSRLARSSTDWHKLLEICALNGTLILDEDGLYDPNNFNDRLLLGLKGTMSEAELHILQARMQGGLLNKAKRGELKIPLPVGFLYNEKDEVITDPDRQVQKAIHLLFQTFRRTGSACATVKTFNEQGFKFPRRLHKGYRKGELIWGQLVHSRTLQILHNPCYAGAYCFGKTRSSKGVDGKLNCHKQKMEDWLVLIKDAHFAYITWEEYEQNQQKLRENAQALGTDRRKSPPREGPALIQGKVICGKCGNRMTVRYHVRNGKIVPNYICQTDGIEHAQKICQNIPGGSIDQAISNLLVEIITPAALEVTMAVQNELYAREKEIEQYYQNQLERARYEVELAKYRYLRVDPANRLVADELEADWNNKLRELSALKDEYEKLQKQEKKITAKQHSEILKIAADFPAIWNNPNVSNKDRKRIVRLIIEDVTLLKEKEITVNIRFKGGASRTIILSKPLCSWEQWITDKKVIQEIDRLLEDHPDYEVVDILNQKGLKSGSGKQFTPRIVARIRKDYSLKDRFSRLRDKGFLTRDELANKLKVSSYIISKWRDMGLIKAQRYDARSYLYEEPAENLKGIYMNSNYQK